ncbi:hypothetical protein DFA_03633 [Cavenderia fasciculata]|uniref:Rab GTPase n=1 Tax=Cavenderia fasciculata TaxID=261658 RepID=F4PIF5_CACFS|nr:uncharacterized protein DFA_03633 [Cavenderia fasciculata]EGG25384.1 hypothetical protein DFA_03633 [Cavenderia fasciculata]|eukprot:XP_004363235.1 hypothetical protein DFA_03633 [Cavenderia fasciculata]
MSCKSGSGSTSAKDQQQQVEIPKEKNHYGSTQFKGRTLFKVAIVGDLGSGKSTIEHQLTGQSVTSIGNRYVKPSNLTLNCLNNQEVNVHFFDSLGQERFGGKLPFSYYRSADFIFVVYDITFDVSFTNLPNWLSEAQQPQINTVAPNILIIGNKLDLVKESVRERAISFEQAQTFANQKGLQYLEISAFKGDNCQSIKDYITNYINQKIKDEQ